MVEIFGRIEEQRVENGQQYTDFIIPAFSKRLAKQRAMQNARLKDYTSPEVDETENIGSGSIPGQTIYQVTVVSDR